MKTKKILFQLIEDVASFENSSTELTFENFILFFNQKHTKIDFAPEILKGKVDAEELQEFNDNRSRDITVLITFMFKYAKNYLKKALENSVINTPDEFAFLITMLRNESLTKTELINNLVTEKTSGVETIKRLIKKGLLEEFKVNNDKKSVHIKITEVGKKSILEITPLMNKVTKVITGNLSESEQNVLSSILMKLEVFHNEIYFNEKNSSIDSIYENKIATKFSN